MHFNSSKEAFYKVGAGVAAIMAFVAIGARFTVAELTLAEARQHNREAAEYKLIVEEVAESLDRHIKNTDGLARNQRLSKIHIKALGDKVNKILCLESNKPEDC